MQRCCIGGSYTTDHQNQFRLQDPVSVLIQDPGTKPEPAEIQRLIGFLGKVAEATGLHMSSPQAPGDHPVPASKMAVIALPLDKKDLTQTMIDGLRLELPGLAGVKLSNVTTDGIDTIVSAMYSKKADAIFLSRSYQGSFVDQVIVIVKPYKSTSLAMIERGFLEGLGYNVDDHRMDGTIFANVPDAGLTDDDFAVLKEIYSQ